MQRLDEDRPVGSYDAFLSYNHQDSVLADRLSRRIRLYRPPRAVGLIKRKLEVFRDVEQLTASPVLSDTLQQRLAKSDYLILLASPAAARSPYVNLEVATFVERQGEARVIVVLCRGELTESLPGSLRTNGAEPLFIDLRNASRKKFRTESLRLIAALFGVDYSVLRREDDERRRRRRNAVIFATLVAAVTLASAYLISVTPAEVWLEQLPPGLPVNLEAVAPVEKIAVNRDDPAVVVWFGHNAQHVRDFARAKTTYRPDKDLGDFQSRAQTRLAHLTEPSDAVEPLATVTMEALDGGKLVGTGELRIYGFMEGSKLRLGRSFGFTGETNVGRQQIVLPLTAHDQDRDPFDLEPWPADIMRRAGIGALDVELRGRISDHTSGDAPQEIRFVEMDKDEAREHLDATAGPEYVVLTHSTAWQARLQDELAADGGEDLWCHLDSSVQWATYKQPERREYEGLHRSDPDELYVGARKRGVEELLARALAREIEEGEVHDVYQVSREVAGSRLSVAVIKSQWEHHESVEQLAPVYLYQTGSDSPWVRVMLPFETASTRVLDVVPLGEMGRCTLIVADSEGFFRTTDVGRTWQNVNFNEPRLRDGQNVRTVTAGTAVYALVVTQTSPWEGESSLFRLKRRNWIDRWRAGAAALLSE